MILKNGSKFHYFGQPIQNQNEITSTCLIQLIRIYFRYAKTNIIEALTSILTYMEVSMKKNTLLIFISMIILVCLFGLAASCNLCGVPIEIGEASDKTGESTKEGSKEDAKTQVEHTQQETTGQTQPAEEQTQQESEIEDAGGVDEEEPPATETNRINIDGSISGYVKTVGVSGDIGGIIYTGNDEDYHSYISALMSFPISDLRGVEVVDAQLEIADIRKFGEPQEFAREFIFVSCYYGDKLGNVFDNWQEGIPLSYYPIENVGDSLVLSNELLISEVQNFIDNDERDWFQISVTIVPPIDEDTEKDGYRFMLEGLFLQVEYIE